MASVHNSPRIGGDTSPSEPLYQVKLLSALRSGDPVVIHPFLAEIARDRRSSDGGDPGLPSAALHLAVRCASIDTISLLLSNRAISPNAVHPNGSGTTALHLAASIGRADVVKLLLEQPEIDDTLKDAQGRTCVDVAKGKAVARAIHDSRAFLDASYRSLLRTYVLSAPVNPAPVALVALLEAPRIRLVDLGYLDDASGSTLLHEAARRKDLRVIELAVRAGADVFVRDRRGKSVADAAGKDDRVKTFLRQFANKDATLIEEESAATEPPSLRGYLNKYTNVARGYHTRWLVLKDGVLSYYHHQEDETIASRGSIATKTAVLKVAPGGDKLRFEVHSTPSRGHSAVQKWYLKANHPVEAARWTQAIGKSTEWYKKLESQRRPSIDSQASYTGTLSIAATRSSLSSNYTRSRIDSSLSSSYVGIGGDDEMDTSGLDEAGPPPSLGAPSHLAPDGDDAEADSASRQSSERGTPPHEATFGLHGNAAVAQLELSARLLAGLAVPPNAPPRTHELRGALADSLGTVQGMLNEYVDMVREREDWWRGRVQRERARQTVWEESLKEVVREGEQLESQLRSRSRRRSRIGDSLYAEGGSTLRRPPAHFSPGVPEGVPEESEQQTPTHAEGMPAYFDAADVQKSIATSPRSLGGAPGTLSPAAGTVTPTASRRISMRVPLPSPGLDVEEGDTDDEDEFFDAIEANALPNLVVADSLVHHVPVKTQGVREMYRGYESQRTHLAITSDDRPPMSLWAVLKGSIGKDLTKISFPVFFNEPTSMLQRMAEDMEFSECLNAAVSQSDPYRRIAFVAAFAMSNYSSTIGRIAKPFNPMLSETFEYVRLDKEYRYMSEQVSHHPPISACFSESPSWRYYGEVDAQNKFMGKSFEIRPTGMAHAELLLPEEEYPDYPKTTGQFVTGKVVEHYSWKKVTTNVSGFILGQPTIDHYGEMTITNHRTNDKCILTFKPRGWRGKDAFEISGRVLDATGAVQLEIAGRWNSQLVARSVGVGHGSLNPDVAVNGPTSPSASPEFVLLWRNSEKPPAPFNLTPFAITLNDCPEDTLRPYLCPTDCRLRPDQRAFELGKYERANALKIAQEEKQRSIRKAREEGTAAPHRPRWFSAETDGDTGERVWQPARDGDELEYWTERSRIWRAGGKAAWKNVDGIFVDEEI